VTKLRAHLQENDKACVTIDEARAILSDARPSWAPEAGGAQPLYTSYKKRRVKALYRALTGASGPRKTAEEYVMIAFLQAGGTPSTAAIKASAEGR